MKTEKSEVEQSLFPDKIRSVGQQVQVLGHLVLFSGIASFPMNADEVEGLGELLKRLGSEAVLIGRELSEHTKDCANERDAEHAGIGHR